MASSTTSDRPTQSRREAFTLVELLVVIGIIALLVAILLPALASARREAGAIKCSAQMRQIGIAFQLYAHDFNGALPVMRQDLPEPVESSASTGYQYWSDLISPYLSKNAKMLTNQSTSGTLNQSDAAALSDARRNVLWGCPAWEGVQTTAGYYSAGGIDKYRFGYGINEWPNWRGELDYAGNPLPGRPRGIEMSVRSVAMTGVSTNGGQRYKLATINRPSERILIADATNWIIYLIPADSTSIGPMNPYVYSYPTVFPSGAGDSFMDRYRHGVAPRTQSVRGGSAKFSSSGGKVAMNALFFDGHTATLTNYTDAYRAVRMRDPGKL